MRIGPLEKLGNGCTVVVLAEPGVGKTFQARYLPPGSVLVDLEGGTLTITRDIVTDDGTIIPRYQGRVISGIDTWEQFAALAALIAGPDEHRRPEEFLSRAAWEAAVAAYPEIHQALEQAPAIFIDSLTWASRLCFEWAKAHPSTWVQKSNRMVQDTWAVYRLLADEMVRFVRAAQSRAVRSGRALICTIVLERDANGWALQLHGQRTGEELRGVFDTIIALVEVAQVDGGIVLGMSAPPGVPRMRAFVCRKDNPWGLPVKDRSGVLGMLEPPRLDIIVSKLLGA